MCHVIKQKLVHIYVPVFTVLTQSIPVPLGSLYQLEFTVGSGSRAGCHPHTVYMLFPVKACEQVGLQSSYLPEISCLKIQLASCVAFVQATWVPAFTWCWIPWRLTVLSLSTSFTVVPTHFYNSSVILFLQTSCISVTSTGGDIFSHLNMYEPIRTAELLYFQTLGWPWVVSMLPNDKRLFSLICRHFLLTLFRGCNAWEQGWLRTIQHEGLRFQKTPRQSQDKSLPSWDNTWSNVSLVERGEGRRLLITILRGIPDLEDLIKSPVIRTFWLKVV